MPLIFSGGFSAAAVDARRMMIMMMMMINNGVSCLIRSYSMFAETYILVWSGEYARSVSGGGVKDRNDRSLNLWFRTIY